MSGGPTRRQRTQWGLGWRLALWAVTAVAPVEGASVELTPTPCCDGRVQEVQVGGERAWQTIVPDLYMYFRIPESFAAAPGTPLYLKITYVDEGGGSVRVQYDSIQGTYRQSEIHFRSSRVGTGQLVEAIHQLESPSLQKRLNGRTDFRLALGAGGEVPLTVKRVIVQDTPGDDARLQAALARPWLTRYPNAPAVEDAVDPRTLKGKVMVGYQGWFRCPNDLADGGWVHWVKDNTMRPEKFTIDMWPDLSEYPRWSLCRAGNLVARNGAPAYLFSSTDPDVVRLHFHWMRKHNVDGAFLQRFLVDGQKGPDGYPEWVLAHVRQAAHAEGRAWAIEYDVSGLTDANVVETIQRDWKWLVDVARIKDDNRYAREAGKPILAVWGLPIRGMTVTVSDAVIQFLKNDPVYGGNYVIGGIGNTWERMTAWQDHFKRYDALHVWQTFSYERDRAVFSSWGKDYFPHIWPGFSWANLTQRPEQYTDREGGQYYWQRLYAAIKAGNDRLFIGMFDEYDEGTAIMPMSDEAPNPPSPYGRFLDNQGKPSDWWLRLTAAGKAMLSGQRSLSASMPGLSELEDRSLATVSAASGERLVAPDAIATAYGAGLASSVVAAPGAPLPTTLGGLTVALSDRAGTIWRAPLFFVSPSQVNFLVPTGVTPGLGTVQIGTRTGTVPIASVAPALFSANASGRGVAAAGAVRVKSDGAQAPVSVLQCGATPGSCAPVPIDLGPESDQVVLILYGTGVRGRQELSRVTCTIGGVPAQVLYAGAQGQYVGLDQVNVLIPRALAGKGESAVVLSVEAAASNAVTVSIR